MIPGMLVGTLHATSLLFVINISNASLTTLAITDKKINIAVDPRSVIFFVLTIKE
jgi:hypothetical protein